MAVGSGGPRWCSRGVFALTRYVSLASIVGSLAFPLFGLHFSASRTPMVIFGFVFIPLLVILKHHENIRRLLNGTENRFGSKRARHGGVQRWEGRQEGGGMSRIGILGAGAWGTALAISLARRGGPPGERCGRFPPEQVQEITESGVNLQFLPGYTVPAEVQVTTDLAAAVLGG